MKNILLILCAVLFCDGNVWAQECSNQDVTFNTQQQLNDFATLNPDCTNFVGNVTISDSPQQNDPVIDLTPLNKIRFVNGNLTISNCNSLNTLAGLEALGSVVGDFEISSLPINDLTGLEELRFVGNRFFLQNNPNLTTLNGLDDLTSIEFEFYLRNNPNLADITSLQGLFVLFKIYIINNASLTSLEGLENLDPFTFRQAEILNNPNLSFCTLESICGTSPIAEGNAPSCNQPEICDPTPVIVSVTEEQATNPAADLVDGSTAADDRWSAKGFPQTVLIDYGIRQDFVGSRMWTYQDRAYQYTIEVSDSPTSGFFQIADRTNNTTSASPIQDNFLILGRYVRLTITGASGYNGQWVSLREFEMLKSIRCDNPQNVAPGKSVTQSSNYNGTLTASKAIDGNTASSSINHTQNDQNQNLESDQLLFG